MREEEEEEEEEKTACSITNNCNIFSTLRQRNAAVLLCP